MRSAGKWSLGQTIWLTQIPLLCNRKPKIHRRSCNIISLHLNLTRAKFYSTVCMEREIPSHFEYNPSKLTLDWILFQSMWIDFGSSLKFPSQSVGQTSTHHTLGWMGKRVEGGLKGDEAMSNQLEWNCLQNRYRILIIKFRLSPPTRKTWNGTESLVKLVIKQIFLLFIYWFHSRILGSLVHWLLDGIYLSLSCPNKESQHQLVLQWMKPPFRTNNNTWICKAEQEGELKDMRMSS